MMLTDGVYPSLVRTLLLLDRFLGLEETGHLSHGRRVDFLQ